MTSLDSQVLYSLEAEMAVLGSVMSFGRKTVAQIVPIIAAEMFQYEGNRRVFEAAMRLHGKGSAVDLITIEAELKIADHLDDAGGRAHLMRCAESVVSPVNAPDYADVVRRYWALRQIESLGLKLQAQVRKPEHAMSMDETLAAAQKEIAMVLARTHREGFLIADVDLEKDRESLTSAFPTINKNASHDGGILKGYQHMFGAREKVGKSIALCMEALNQIQNGKAGCYYSVTDLNQADIARRLMRMKTGWGKRPTDNFDLQLSWDEAWSMIGDPFAQFRIYTGREHGQTIDDVCGHIRALHASQPLDFAVVDYLQSLRPSASQSRMNQFDRIADNAWRLSWLAEDLNIALLIATQVSNNEREGLMAKGGRDVMESANWVAFLSRDKDDPDMVKAEVPSMRHGLCPYSFWLCLDRSRVKFNEKGDA